MGAITGSDQCEESLENVRSKWVTREWQKVLKEREKMDDG